MNVDRLGFNVSRETLDGLTRLHDLVQKWSSTINLVSKSSVSSLWERHIWDSAQVAAYAVNGKNWVDIGSGGGFPGLVVSILAKHDMPERHVTLVESDVRKATFLRTVVRDLELNCEVVTQRIESCPPFEADVLSARALSDLPGLLLFAEQHLSRSGTALFLKGETWEKEVKIARESWSFVLEAHKSKTKADAAILEIKEIQRV